LFREQLVALHAIGTVDASLTSEPTLALTLKNASYQYQYRMSNAPTATLTLASPGTAISTDALHFLAEGHSIYEARMSGEQIRHHVLPINTFVESTGRSNDADEDTLYARSLLGLLARPSASHL